MNLFINKNVPNETFNRLNVMRRLFTYYARRNNITPPSQRIIGTAMRGVDEFIGKELRLRFITWLIGRKVDTCKIESGLLDTALTELSKAGMKINISSKDKAKYGITGAEAFALVMLFRPTKSGNRWTFLNEDQFKKDMKYIQQGFTKTKKAKATA